jgi:hypothetical protein
MPFHFVAFELHKYKSDGYVAWCTRTDIGRAPTGHIYAGGDQKSYFANDSGLNRFEQTLQAMPVSWLLNQVCDGPLHLSGGGVCDMNLRLPYPPKKTTHARLIEVDHVCAAAVDTLIGPHRQPIPACRNFH